MSVSLHNSTHAGNVTFLLLCAAAAFTDSHYFLWQGSTWSVFPKNTMPVTSHEDYFTLLCRLRSALIPALLRYTLQLFVQHQQDSTRHAITASELVILRAKSISLLRRRGRKHFLLCKLVRLAAELARNLHSQQWEPHQVSQVQGATPEPPFQVSDERPVTLACCNASLMNLTLETSCKANYITYD